jgi:uncharacterized protein (TIGR02099 family)
MDSAPPLSPLLLPRRVRLAARVARGLLWLVVAFWLLVGLSWGLLHGWIVPRISEFRPSLEAQASRALGVPVRIGELRMRSQGLIPSFELRDVTFLDPEGRTALRLPSVVAALSPRSAWRLGFEQLVIDGAELDIRRRTDGRLEVAGLDLSPTAGRERTDFADWALAQTELVLRGGTLRWTDELRGAPMLALTDVQAVLRNPGQRHLMRLDATPPPAWGERFSLRAMLKTPLLATRHSPWLDWSGDLYAEFSRADVSLLRQYIRLDPLGVDISSGQGALRAWAEVVKGDVTGGTADVNLQGVNTRLGSNLQPLALNAVAGRFGGRQLGTGFELRTEGLSFVADDGLVWPGGNVVLLHTPAESLRPANTELKADRLDLAALSRIARRLPLDASTHQMLDSFAPHGLVEQISASWQGDLSAPLVLAARGRVSGLALAAGAAPVGSALGQPGRPGIDNATVDFTLTDEGGQAQVQIAQGALTFPGVFEQPRVPFAELSTELQWKHQGARQELYVRKLRFANADAAGQAEVHWHSAEGAGAGHPGVLDLQGSLSRGNAAQVHRYLPLVLPDTARHYVRDAVTLGRLSEVKFKIKGDLQQLPFADPKQGEFLVTAKASDVQYAYVPPSAVRSAAASKNWPALEALKGELVFNRQSLEVREAQGRVAGLTGLQLTRGSARIPNLAKSVVEVNTAVKGSLAQGLQFVNNSPVSAMLSDALLQATATGPADYNMRLMLPLADLAQTSVQGSLTLPGNDVQFMPGTPVLGRLRGALAFTENSFRVSNAQARMLGGELRFEGGQRATPAPGRNAGNLNANTEPAEAPLLFRGQGTVTAEGLRQARELGLVSTLAEHASGSTSYSASLGFRRGHSEISVSSSLQGLALSLPAPLNKTTTEALPLQFDQTLLRESLAPGQNLQDQLSLSLGRLAQVRYVRDISTGEARVLRGSIAVGLEAGESAAMPAADVAANVNLQRADLDAWGRVLAKASVNTSPAPAAGNAGGYMPSVLALRANELTLQGYQLHKLVMGASREGSTWRANMDADELSGYAEYRQPSAAPGGVGGRLYSRLSRLKLAASTARDVEALLEGQPGAIPALDVVVDDFELKGKKLGRLEVEAVNRAAQTQTPAGSREWRLNKLNLSMPEAVFSANGNWAAGAGSERRRVQMNYRLDIADSGELLKRLGMDGLIRRGKGRLDGQVGWLGSPLTLDYPSMGGQFNVNIESGQFLKADPGIAKLLGVLNLQALPRRLTLDFRDVFSEGFAFDFVRGDVTIEQGLARTNNLQMKGVNAAVLMEGSANIARETQDLRVVIVPEVNAGTASLIASVINPAVGLGSFLAQMFLSRPLAEANTQEFHIDGAWSDPRINRVERKPAAGGARP